ncbi:hypothetical protein PAPYR_5419 [Paratrimastix pyriformis]|uniref:Uncharacterized protein n=1 Tax=Paratrimastix pyriformis TaxID=342808 RepID=A0ABQ8UN22_9EUKA|nr:hypothetical protein PAPYR_5419 [Paratrimastix pyriformis]
MALLIREKQHQSAAPDPRLVTVLSKLSQSLFATNFSHTTSTMIQRIHIRDVEEMTGGSAAEKSRFPSFLMGTASAVLFWSFLAEIHEGTNVSPSTIRDQLNKLVYGLQTQFWDQEHRVWRKSAASDVLTADEAHPAPVRFRAVDQALALMVLLRVIRLGGVPSLSPEKALHLAWRTIHAILDTTSSSRDAYCFGYSAPATAQSYIDIAHPEMATHVPVTVPLRILWHDAWVIIALLAARRLESCTVESAEPSPPPHDPRAQPISEDAMTDHIFALVRHFLFLYLRKVPLPIGKTFVYSSQVAEPVSYINDLALCHLIFRSIREEAIAPGGMIPRYHEYSRLLYYLTVPETLILPPTPTKGEVAATHGTPPAHPTVPPELVESLVVCPTVLNRIAKIAELVPASPYTQLLMHSYSTCPFHREALGREAASEEDQAQFGGPSMLPPRRKSLPSLLRESASPFPVLFRKPADQEQAFPHVILHDPVVVALPESVEHACGRCMWTSTLPIQVEQPPPPDEGAGLGALELRPRVVPPSTMPTMAPPTLLGATGTAETPLAVRPTTPQEQKNPEPFAPLHSNTETAFALIVSLDWFRTPPHHAEPAVTATR